MPTLPEAWAKLGVKVHSTRLSVAKELARDNVDGSDGGGGDKDDEEENDGDDIGPVFGEDDGRQTGVRLQGAF